MNRPNYPIDPNHKYNPEMPIILDDDPVKASTDVNPRFAQVLNNIEYVKKFADTSRAIVNSLLGFDVVSAVETYEKLTSLDTSYIQDGTQFLVLKDKNNTNKTAVYEFIDGKWNLVSAVNIDLKDFVTLDMLNVALELATSGIDLSALDVLVSSRAPANTALSNEVWTDALATAIAITNSRIQGNITQAILDAAARLTDARAVNIDRIGRGSNAASRLFNDAMTLFSALREIVENQLGANNSAASAALTANQSAKLNEIIRIIGSTGNGVRANVSVQRGTIGANISGTQGAALLNIPINAVNIPRTLTDHSFKMDGTTTNQGMLNYMRTLPNSTTLSLQRASSVFSSTNHMISWEVTSFL